jgi:hypothetical protein
MKPKLLTAKAMASRVRGRTLYQPLCQVLSFALQRAFGQKLKLWEDVGCKKQELVNAPNLIHDCWV